MTYKLTITLCQKDPDADTPTEWDLGRVAELLDPNDEFDFLSVEVTEQV